MSNQAEIRHWVPAPAPPDGRFRAWEVAGVYVAHGETVEWYLTDEGRVNSYRIIPVPAAAPPPPAAKKPLTPGAT